jgi:hypothetical protein
LRISILHVHAACPLSMLLVHASCPCSPSMLLVHATCRCCKFKLLLHILVHAPCLHAVHAAWIRCRNISHEHEPKTKKQT